MRCADECQNVALPSLSSHVRRLSVESELIGRVRSHTCPLIRAASTLRARPSLIDFAISIAVTPSLYSLVFPSGKVILIIRECFFFLPMLFYSILQYEINPEKRGKFNEQFADRHLRNLS